LRQISEDEDVESDLNNLSLDIDFPHSSVDSSKEIDLKELEDIAEIQTFADKKSSSDRIGSSVKLRNDEDCDVAGEEIKEEVQSEEINIVLPSAPSFDVQEEVRSIPKALISVPSVHTAASLYEKTLYPDLKELAPSQIKQISEKIISPVAVKPFTPLQIEQLYSNREIQLADLFEGEFVEKELKDNSIQDHQLYVLLRKYGKSRAKHLINSRNIAHLTKTLDENYKKIWRIEKRNVSGHGFCECGKAVRGSHDFCHAVFDEDVNAEMNRNLKELLNMSCFNHTKFSQDCELYRRQIEQMIGELMNSKAFAQITKDSPVVLLDEVVYPDLKSKVNDLRLYISILFKFFRDAIHDKQLILTVQDWIIKLVSLQLRIATWQDHIFILFHILRCPVGVGNWAASLIQVPVVQISLHESKSPFTYPEFQHCVALLSALLLPIKDRGTFLEGITKDLVPSSDNKEEAWILVDSDGEEGSSPSGECIGLKENDLVAIYDQIPVGMLFKLMTHTRNHNNEYILDEEMISGHHIIKTIAFSSKFIAILKQGLTTYDSERYKQFAKRLGRLMKHTLFYVSDIIQLYRNKNAYNNSEETDRIQIEFDELIFRSAHFIYASKKLSLFQYLADFPYQLVSIKSLWKLFYCLHVGDFKIMEEGEFLSVNRFLIIVLNSLIFRYLLPCS
jgi:ectopic P granules protein 5